jgi:hypothetical protein
MRGVKMKQIQLTQGKFALVDDEDFERINRFKWYAHNCGRDLCYATRHKKDSTQLIRMHQEVMNQKQIDHKNGDGLDNRKQNLRPCTHQQNIANSRLKAPSRTSKYRGVHRKTGQRKWRASIGKSVHIGYYENESMAAKAYDRTAKRHFGKFAKLNFSTEKAGQLGLFE